MAEKSPILGTPHIKTARSSRISSSSGSTRNDRQTRVDKHRSKLAPLQTKGLERNNREISTPETVGFSTPPTGRRKKRNVRTPDTVASTPPTIVIENRIPREKEEKRRFCTRRKLICCLVLYCLLATGAGAYFFRYVIAVANLKEQIDRLSDENDRLEGAVDDLSGEIDRLQNTTENLEDNIIELDIENNETKGLMNMFNSTILAYKLLNNQLKEENEIYALNNKNLEDTIENLDDQIVELQKTEVDLRSSVEEYQGANQELELKLLALEQLRDNLNDTVLDLTVSINDFKAENDRMLDINKELNTVLSFINETFEDTEQTYDELISALDETIVQSRVLAEEGLKSRMKTEANGWECGLSIAFAAESFIKDTTLPVGTEYYGFVIDYIESKVLADLCIDTTNFELFITKEILGGGLVVSDASITDLTLGLNVLADQAFQYYFPTGNGGLSDEDWVLANYDCENLKNEQKYIYDPSTF